MNEIFKQTTEATSGFLSDILPTINDNWWIELVLNNIKPRQKDKIVKAGDNSLQALDLSALLRVFDQNWYILASKLNMESEQRHYLKEMQTVRNRWAHTNSRGISADDQYRDLDTIQRFMQMINAEPQVIANLKQRKRDVMMEKSEETAQNTVYSEPEQSPPNGYIPGQIVRAKSNPEWQGAITSIQIGEPENRITVYGTAGLQSFYESQIEIVPQKHLALLTVDDFHAAITSLQIRYPNLSTLYSLNAARIEFIPYQFRPVIKFIRSDRPRLLIADSVGVGKTIEAGLILRELQARRDIQSVLVICPKPLIVENKWQTELRRFDESFTQMNGAEFRFCIEDYHRNGSWPEKQRKTIVPYSIFDEELLLGVKKRGKKIMGLLDLDPPPRFDLVIVDEAHHIRNENTANHKIVKFFCDNAEAVVFLTATPIQMGNRDLFVLLNTLRPDLIINEKNFEHLSAPNKFINSAAKLVRQANTNWQNEAAESLREAADTAWGHSMLTTNPTWVRLIKDLDGSDLKQERRVQMISEVEDLHTFNGIINRTRRRDIDVITTRSPETLSIPFTLEQEFIHTELLSIQKTILSSIHGSTSINFMMSTIRRQAASCILGLVPFLRDILSRHLSDLDWDEMDQTAPNEQMINEIKDQVNAMIELCSSLSNEDPKLAALKRIISDKQTLENNKIMVFSSFRHTLSYLYRHLIKDGFRIGLIHGGTKDEDRKELKRRFELSREEQDCIDVMLFSEVGCEGLDYQFCDAMVNYDLPWNPMRIEQRIGRIDRRKQKSPKVFIYNMITPGTIDADIYDRCLIRIGIFNSSLGDSEAILGDIASKIRIIGENLELTPEERKDKLQQLADNEIRTIQEQEKLEQQQYELFGIDVPKKQAEKDIHSASSFWLSPKMLEHMISCYLKNRIGRDQVYFLGDKESKTLRLAQEARAKLLADYQSLKLPNTMTGREWELYLKGGNQYIGVTFNISYAMDNSKVVLLNPIHPMVKQAASFLKQSSDTYALLDVTDALLTAGSYNFVIYQWQLHGLKNDLKLQTVCSSETIGNSLTRLLELATNAAEGSFGEVSPDHWDYLDKEHYKLWNLAKADHRAKVSDLVAYRKESLKTTHKARMEFINDKISSMIEEKILRMYYSWLANAEADFARRMQELDIAVEKADITANVVMYGIIRIKENRHGN